MPRISPVRTFTTMPIASLTWKCVAAACNASCKAPWTWRSMARGICALQDELQAAATHFQVKDAIGMVVNVRTGEILGMASYPVFDANDPGKTSPDALVNHAAQTVYEPGSVFKVFTLAMGLDTGLVDVNTLFNVCSPPSL